MVLFVLKLHLQTRDCVVANLAYISVRSPRSQVGFVTKSMTFTAWDYPEHNDYILKIAAIDCKHTLSQANAIAGLATVQLASSAAECEILKKQLTALERHRGVMSVNLKDTKSAQNELFSL